MQLLIIFMALLTAPVWAQSIGIDGDEPIIITEVQGKRGTIVTGVVGDNALNLYRTDSPRGGWTTGVVGDSPVSIYHSRSPYLENYRDYKPLTWDDPGTDLRTDSQRVWRDHGQD